MLNKKDLSEINSLIKSALTDFYETLLVPHFEQSEKEHKEIRKELRESREELIEHIKDHEKRIRKLEVITAS